MRVKLGESDDQDPWLRLQTSRTKLHGAYDQIPGDLLRLLEDEDIRILEDGSYRLLENLPPPDP